MYLLQTFTTHCHLTETIKMRGNNPILALKLHILLHILMKSTHFHFDEMIWQPYLLQTFTTHFHLTRRSKWGVNNPILALKLHILLHILMKSICISFKPLQPTFIWWDDQNEGWQPYTSIKTTHFASYLDEIYMYLLQTFTTHFHLTRRSKWGVTTLY